jgi:hypothetical protein
MAATDISLLSTIKTADASKSYEGGSRLLQVAENDLRFETISLPSFKLAFKC